MSHTPVYARPARSTWPHGHGRSPWAQRDRGTWSSPAPRLLPASRRSNPSPPAAPGSARLGGGPPAVRGPAPTRARLARSTGPRAAPALRPSRHLRSPPSPPCRTRVLSARRCGHARLPSPFPLQPEPSPCRRRGSCGRRCASPSCSRCPAPPLAAAGWARRGRRRGLRSLFSRAFSSRSSARGTPPATPPPPPPPPPLRGRRPAAGTPLPAEVCLRPGQAPAAPRLSAGPPPPSLGARPRLPGGGDSAARRLGGGGRVGTPAPDGSPFLLGGPRSWLASFGLPPAPPEGSLPGVPPPPSASGFRDVFTFPAGV